MKPKVAEDGRRKSCLFGKKFRYGQIFKNVFWKDSWRHRSMSCVQISWNL